MIGACKNGACQPAHNARCIQVNGGRTTPRRERPQRPCARAPHVGRRCGVPAISLPPSGLSPSDDDARTKAKPLGTPAQASRAHATQLTNRNPDSCAIPDSAAATVVRITRVYQRYRPSWPYFLRQSVRAHCGKAHRPLATGAFFQLRDGVFSVHRKPCPPRTRRFLRSC
jgi:hypothetical protein